MTVKVLIVDDSGFFLRRLAEMINGCEGLKVVGTASNGREAIEKVLELKPDVITMDYEMPVMDGITAVRQIMAKQPTPILMFSSLTYEGARVTLDSLEAGAVDFLPKNFDEISRNSSDLRNRLAERIRVVANSGKSRLSTAAISPVVSPTHSQTASSQTSSSIPRSAPVAKLAPEVIKPVTNSAPVAPPSQRTTRKHFSIVLIGTSTGGPVALQNVLTKLPASFSAPIVLIQHMPATFTPAFAERLNSQCRIKVKEAEDGETLKSGTAYLAPGGKQLLISQGNVLKVLPGDERLNYKPSVDITFASAANIYGDKALGIILTGMGSDGCEGARLLKKNGATIWSQDEASCVIYGMPMAVAKANLSDEILSLTDVGSRLAELQ
jgi:two-component system chemotaxis response regulator CheB